MSDLHTEPLEAALALYTARQERQNYPIGTFDSEGRWYPDPEEYRDCCQEVRSPTRAYPYSYMLHCRTLKHIARLHALDERALRAAANARKRTLGIKPRREGGNHYYKYYKAVAIAPGPRLLSIYDGETEYCKGITVSDPARQGHAGGIYVYPSADAAADAALPWDSMLRCLPRAILRVRAEGPYCRYDNGKLAFSRVTPLEIESFLPRGMRKDEWETLARALMVTWADGVSTEGDGR
jgi:hypothetical protein